MKKTLLALALVAGLTSFAGSAKAGLVNVNFSTGNGANDFSGQIFGLNDNGDSTPTSILVKSIGGKTLASEFSFSSLGFHGFNFNVSNGVVTYLDWRSIAYQGNFAALEFDNYPWGAWNNFMSQAPDYMNVNVDNNNPVSFTIDNGSGSTAAVPEPSQVAASLLLVGGIAGFVIVRRRKESALALAA